ncbi:hypothetical protein KKC45_03030 [Patescibacteria group bacterium]|nr:hypothetical protein [Patescibacteria group bacterium]
MFYLGPGRLDKDIRPQKNFFFENDSSRISCCTFRLSRGNCAFCGENITGILEWGLAVTKGVEKENEGLICKIKLSKEFEMLVRGGKTQNTKRIFEVVSIYKKDDANKKDSSIISYELSVKENTKSKKVETSMLLLLKTVTGYRVSEYGGTETLGDFHVVTGKVEKIWGIYPNFLLRMYPGSCIKVHDKTLKCVLDDSCRVAQLNFD